jgi:hypothetical protein
MGCTEARPTGRQVPLLACWTVLLPPRMQIRRLCGVRHDHYHRRRYDPVEIDELGPRQRILWGPRHMQCCTCRQRQTRTGRHPANVCAATPNRLATQDFNKLSVTGSFEKEGKVYRGRILIQLDIFFSVFLSEPMWKDKGIFIFFFKLYDLPQKVLKNTLKQVEDEKKKRGR